LIVGEALGALEAREARLLLAAATGLSEASLLAHRERLLPPGIEEKFFQFVQRRAAGEPIAYILGKKEFYGLMLAVTPAVLIPRPETELLVERALARNPATVLDLGTGSGAIALAIKRHLPAAHVVAVEASGGALAVARRNAVQLGLEVEFRHGRWFEPVAGARFDLIVSNPPYVARGDAHLAQGDLRFEPQSALVAGPDGLDAFRGIARGAPAHLNPGGWLLLEHGLGQDQAVRELLLQAGLEDLSTWPDLAGIARVSGGGLK
jgi:release factor glutamine methyltransferase